MSSLSSSSSCIKLPNILITGTPGCGKTCLSSRIVELCSLSLNHVKVGEIIKSKELHDGYDEEYDTYILNEDKVCDELEDLLSLGGQLVDFHTCDFMPQRWFQLVLVLRCDNSILYKRLEDRGYKQNKIQENIEAEIMQVCEDEAKDSYDNNIVIVLQNNNIQELEDNAQRVVLWIQNYIKNNTNNNSNNINNNNTNNIKNQ